MINKPENIRKEAIMTQFVMATQYFSEDSEENHEKRRPEYQVSWPKFDTET
jgi:hypothetical protein